MWCLDDILIHATSIEINLNSVACFLQFCREYNFKLQPVKCTLFSRSFRWCGRTITLERVRFDPHCIDGIRDVSSPKTGVNLQEFICAMHWMQSSTPAFSSVTL